MSGIVLAGRVPPLSTGSSTKLIGNVRREDHGCAKVARMKGVKTGQTDSRRVGSDLTQVHRSVYK